MCGYSKLFFVFLKPLIHGFLSKMNIQTITPKYLQKILGYSLTGETNAQSFFIFWGRGSNGKSLLLNLLDKILDKAYKPPSKEIFVKSNSKWTWIERAATYLLFCLDQMSF